MTYVCMSRCYAKLNVVIYTLCFWVMDHNRMPSNVMTTFSMRLVAWLLSSSGPALKHISTTSLYLLPTLLPNPGTRPAKTTRSLHFSAEYVAL